MSTSIETSTITPVLPVPPKDESIPVSAAVIQVDEHPVNTETTQEYANAETTQVQEHVTTTRVTPVQRLSSVFNKAKQSMTDAVSDAQKALNERNTHKKATKSTNATTSDISNSTNINTSTPVTIASHGKATTIETTEDNLGGGPNNAFKGILNRVKGFKTAHVSVAEPTTSVTEETTRNEGAPIPPPKDHAKTTETTAPTTNPVLDQFKRNTALLTKFLLQKKKDFTERKSSDANQQENVTPKLHSETGTTDKPTSNGSPLARRITQLVNNATASKNKKRNTETDHAVVVTEPTIVNETPATDVTSTACVN